VVQSVHGALGLSQNTGDLRGREAENVSEDYHVALLARQLVERAPNVMLSFLPDLTGIARHAQFRGWCGSASPKVVKSAITGDPEDPGRERHLALFVFPDHVNQFEEHVLGDIFRIVRIPYQALHVPENIGRVARIEELDGVDIAFLGTEDGAMYERAIPSR
jgi:hypothetical protein